MRVLVRHFLLLSAVAIVFSFMNMHSVQAFSGSGSGTSMDPYQISTCAELQDMTSDLTAFYKLVDNVDCNGFAFVPIGDSATPFSGSLDGEGYGIKNLTITSSASEAGLFGELDYATVQDVAIENSSVSGAGNVGMLAGTTYYANISFVAGLDITVNGTGDNVGGLVGQLGGSTLEKSYVEGVDVTGGGSKTGGLVGWAVGPASVSSAYASGAVTASTNVGGVIGQLGAGPSVANEIYADVTFGASGSAEVGSTDFGAMPGSSFVANGTYVSTSSVAPLNSWDFTNTWYVRQGKYPGLRAHTLPTMLCFAPQSTNTTISAECMVVPLFWGSATWEARYSLHGQNNWQTITLADIHKGAASVVGLISGTWYDLQLRYTNDYEVGQWGTVQILTTGTAPSNPVSTTSTPPTTQQASKKLFFASSAVASSEPTQNAIVTSPTTEKTTTKIGANTATEQQTENKQTATEKDKKKMNWVKILPPLLAVLVVIGLFVLLSDGSSKTKL